jgi:hypothetical protein
MTVNLTANFNECTVNSDKRYAQSRATQSLTASWAEKPFQSPATSMLYKNQDSYTPASG